MALRAPDVEDFHLRVVDDHAPGIVGLVHVAIDLEAGAGRGRANQIDDGGKSPQRLPAPVLADEQEQGVFDAAPFAGDVAPGSWTTR